jgi:hypothetical protein
MKTTRVSPSRTLRWIALPILMAFSAATISAQANPQAPPAANDPHSPVLPRIADADPSILHAIVARVPTQLKVARTSGTLSILLVSPRTVNLTVGQNMVTGFESDLQVYPEGTERPLKPRGMYLTSSLLNFGSGNSILNASTDGIPVPGTKYIVEEEITIFETDVPSQHMWTPKGSPNYKVLWQGVLKQIVN